MFVPGGLREKNQFYSDRRVSDRRIPDERQSGHKIATLTGDDCYD